MLQCLSMCYVVFINFYKPQTTITTDASNYGWGAVRKGESAAGHVREMLPHKHVRVDSSHEGDTSLGVSSARPRSDSGVRQFNKGLVHKFVREERDPSVCAASPGTFFSIVTVETYLTGPATSQGS